MCYDANFEEKNVYPKVLMELFPECILMDLLRDVSVRSEHFSCKVIHNQDCESHNEIM